MESQRSMNSTPRLAERDSFRNRGVSLPQKTASRTSPSKFPVEQRSDLAAENSNLGEKKEDDRAQAAQQCDLILANLKHMYDSRYAFLKEYMENILKHVQHDQILLAMKEDPSLQEFVSGRIKEIFAVRFTLIKNRTQLPQREKSKFTT